MGKNKPKLARSVDLTQVSQMDVCQTPPHALYPLLPYIPKDWIIWESAVGPEQLLAIELRKQGYVVLGTDLLYGENYFDDNSVPVLYNIQLTNMPFSIKYQWLERAFELGKPFALLAPYETTFAGEFKRLFDQYNGNPWFIEKISPERRINFKMPNMGWGEWRTINDKPKYVRSTAQMPTAWITWGLDIWKTRQDFLRTYTVDMPDVQYDEHNNPLTKEQIRERNSKEEG